MATVRLPFLPTSSFPLPAAASTVSSPQFPGVNSSPSHPSSCSSSTSSKPLYPSSTVASAPSAASTAAAPQPQDDEDWLYQHHLCETAMLVTRLVFHGEEGEEGDEDDQIPSAAGTVLGGNAKKRRVRIGRDRAARAASRAAHLGDAATTDGWNALFRPRYYYPYAANGNGRGMPPSFHLPSALSAAGELAPPPGLPPPPGLALLSATTTTMMTVTKDRSNKNKKEGWMEGVSKRAFYKRRRKARQAAEYVVDCVLQEVERRVMGLEVGAGEE